MSTVGVSAVIAPDGEVQQAAELFTADSMVATVPLRASLTPADLLGSTPATVTMLLAGAVVLLGLLRPRQANAARVADRT
ncbi:apolipoprotein N-acyltransferase [compost metagenome]